MTCPKGLPCIERVKIFHSPCFKTPSFAHQLPTCLSREPMLWRLCPNLYGSSREMTSRHAKSSRSFGQNHLNIGSRYVYILHLTCKLDTSQLKAARQYVQIMVAKSFFNRKNSKVLEEKNCHTSMSGGF